MNRIDQLFQNKGNNVLSVYFTAGYPELADTGLVIRGLEEAGADLVEIGFPFSDPVADGPVIQASSHRALENGMNLDILFEQLAAINHTSRIPKILMGYFNTVYQYGVEKFVMRGRESGVDGVIIPDLPPEIYESDYQKIFQTAGLHFICLVSPQTPAERTRYLAGLSRGFIYLLSSSSTTGTHVSRDAIGRDAIGRDAKYCVSTGHKKLPTLIGFGIHDHRTFKMACQQASGAIIGSEFIRRLTSELPLEGDRSEGILGLCRRFVGEIRG